MVLKLIGLVVLFCTLANANESDNGSQCNCNWAHGIGTCKWIYACKAYVNHEVSFNHLTRCEVRGYENSYCHSNLGNGICKRRENCEPYVNYKKPQWSFTHCNHDTICCVSTETDATNIKLKMNTNQFVTTTTRTTSTTSTIAPHGSNWRVAPPVVSSTAVRNSCNTIQKTGNCYENSYCHSNLGNGICKRRENCEPYVNYKKPQWSFTHCNHDTICCVSTETDATNTKLKINTNQFVTTTTRTTSTTSTIAPHGSNWRVAPPVVSSTAVRNSCNTIQKTGNCYESSPCTSPSGNGTCTRPTRCASVYTGSLQSRYSCSRDLVCCLSIRQASSATTPEINNSMFSGTTRTEHFTRSPNVPLRANRKDTDLEKRCNSLTGPGTCKLFSQCAAFNTRFGDMVRCDGKHMFCCPNRPTPNGGTTTTPKPKSVEGNHCSIFPYATGICTVLHQCQSYLQGTVKNETLNRCLDTSRPRKDLVCCPRVTSTSTTTMRTEPLPKPEPQVRPAEKACEVYKATNPKRLLTHMPGVTDARNGEFPHVGIVMGSSNGGGSSLRQYCGAALIAQSFALTTANCARSLPQGAFIRFGSVDTNPLKTTAQRFDVKFKNIWLQDDNKESEDYHDLAVLEFFEDIPLSSSVHPACLRLDEEDLPRSANLYVNGWTTNDESNNYISPVLYTSTVNTAILVGCNFTHYNLGVSRRFIEGVQLGQYCARNSKREQCDGDSGFPLMREANGQFEIVGIMSMEFGCSSTLPSIYTRVAYYIDWIEEIVWPNGTQNV